MDRADQTELHNCSHQQQQAMFIDGEERVSTREICCRKAVEREIAEALAKMKRSKEYT